MDNRAFHPFHRWGTWALGWQVALWRSHVQRKVTVFPCIRLGTCAPGPESEGPLPPGRGSGLAHGRSRWPLSDALLTLTAPAPFPSSGPSTIAHCLDWLLRLPGSPGCKRLPVFTRPQPLAQSWREALRAASWAGEDRACPTGPLPDPPRCWCWCDGWTEGLELSLGSETKDHLCYFSLPLYFLHWACMTI